MEAWPRAPRASTTRTGDREITVVRVDPRRFVFRFLSEVVDGPRRTLPRWVRDHHLVGGINAGMFMSDGRSVGYMMRDDVALSARRPATFRGVIALDPRATTDAAVRLGGDGCGGDVDSLRRAYRSILQVREVLIDCSGQPRSWSTRRYSAAALGMDTRGNVVLVHVRTAYPMNVLARMLTDLNLGLRGLTYLEGGPEASLVVADGETRVSEMGSWEDGFNPNDDNRVFWDLPNVIGFTRR